MAIKSVAELQSSTDLVRSKLTEMLARDKYDYAASTEGNITVRGTTPAVVAGAIEKELNISFVMTNQQVYTLHYGDCTLSVAGQGKGTLILVKSY